MKRTPPLAEHFPQATEAAQWDTTDLGSSLTQQAIFGHDPFTSDDARNACQAAFHANIQDMNTLIHRPVNGDFTPLQDAVMTLIDLTRRYIIISQEAVLTNLAE